MGCAGRLWRCRGVSLVELLIVIAVIGIMGTMGLILMRNVLPTSSASTAERNLNFLNGAVVAFNQASWELVLTAENGTNDEAAIFNSLRYRDVANPLPGSPYLPATTVFIVSSNTADYRARWNGRMFAITMPGSSGMGINLLRMSGAAPQAFVTNTPVPRQTN